MNILLLALVSLLLCLGMLLVPSLSGEGAGSLFARAWLLFGLLVFGAHYAYYLRHRSRAKNSGEQTIMAHQLREQSPVRSREHM